MHHERERQKTENEGRKPMFEKPKYERHIKYFNSSGTFYPGIHGPLCHGLYGRFYPRKSNATLKRPSISLYR